MAPSSASPAEAVSADASADVALFGKDPMPRLVDVHPLMDGPSDHPARVRLYQRSEDFADIIEHEDSFFPFFFLSDITLLRGMRDRFRFQRLQGDNFFRHLVVFRTWDDYWDAVRTVERRTDSDEGRPDELYRVGSPVQQYLMQTGRTCLLDMTLDDLHRLQLDIEVYTEGGFPNAERPEDKIIIVALSDNRGWDQVLHLRDGIDEATLLRELVHVLRERDPDVIEGHNCFPAGTPVLTPDGYQPIEELAVGDRVLSNSGTGIEEDRVTETFSTSFEGELVTLRATYLGTATSTPDHPHYGYRQGEGIGYHAAEKFECGDYLARPSSDLVPDDLELDDDLYLAGLLFADGHLSKATNRITFGNTNHDLVAWVGAHLGGKGTIYRREGNERHAPLLRLRTHDPSAHDWLQSIGVPEGNKSADTAPISFERVVEQGPSAAASFLVGVIEGDGHLSEANGSVQVAVGSKNGTRALKALAQHLGLVVSENTNGIILWPTRTTRALLYHILSWLRSDEKRAVNINSKSRRPDELPFAVIEKVKPFIDRLGISYEDFPVPRTTVNYYLNGRTSINRGTFADIEATVQTAVSASGAPFLQQKWEEVGRELNEIKSYHWFPIRETSQEPFTGTVYNIETGNHNYIADGILTHNCFSFDLSYILDRCEMHGVDFAIGRDGSTPRTYDSSMRFAERTVDYPAVDIAGRHIIDTYFQVMSFDVFSRDLPDYSLKTAARYFGLAPEDRTYIEGADISRAWREDRETLLDYALDDVIETRRLAGHLSGSTFYLAQMLPMTYGSSARRGPAAKIESLFVREYLRTRHALPRSEWGSQSMGGYTDIFITGVMEPVVYADVESLYPSIMLNYDVQPSGDTLDLFPQLLERLTDLRLETKEDMRNAEDEEIRSELDARQSSYKVLINCFDPETEVMTVDGIKSVDEVEVGDRVYSLNPDTQEVEIKPVTATQAQHYEGPMVKIKNRHTDFLVTPNHRFLTQKFTSGEYTDLEWEVASDMLNDRIRRRLPSLQPLPACGGIPSSVSLSAACNRHDIEYKAGPRGIKELRRQARWQPGEYKLSDWLRILAWFATEGTLYKSKARKYENGNVRGVSYRTTLCQKNAVGRNDIADLLDRTGITYSSDQNGHSFCSKVLYKILEAECGSDSFSKHLPPWIFQLGPDQLRIVFDTLMQGDGNARGDRFTTSSDQLAEDFLRLAMHVGRRAFHMPNDGSHRIQVNKVRGQRPTIKPKHRQQVDYSGMIYCLTVADNHTVLAGRNRKFNWTGQSFYGVLGFSLSVFNDFAEADRVARTGQEILRELIDEIRNRGGTVIEVDTDGVLFVPPDGVRGEEAEVDFTVGLTEAMPEGIRVGFDGRFKKMLSYKKKNYALLTYDDELKFKGSSLISRSNEPFGRRFVRQAIRRLLDHDVDGLHNLYVDTRSKIIESDWESVDSFARTETLKDTLEQYEADVEDGQRPRAATYELAKQKQERTGKPVKKGDRITYYITGEDANVTAFQHCALAADWDPENPDENTAYYLKRLNEFATKFEPFFTEEDFRLVFSPEDMFGFSADGIEIQTVEHESDAPTDGQDEVPF
jgi:DNA polymerase elongation subunit (family B)